MKKGLKDYHSPEQIAGRLKKASQESLSHKTIYQMIYQNYPWLWEVSRIPTSRTGKKWFFVTWHHSIRGHKSTKFLSGKRLNWLVRSISQTIDKNRQMPFYIRVTSLRTPVYCITQTEGPGDRWQILVHSQEFIGGVIRRCRGERTLQDRRSH